MQLTDLAILSPVWPIFFLLVAGLLGACLGSFVNCLAWRLVHGESVWKGRSHCAVCNHPLAPLDLVPVLSWLFLGVAAVTAASASRRAIWRPSSSAASSS